ncbi:MAG: DNA repair protein RecN [Gammaproteobacteria bacterium]|nr:DNA repair protein RecN [Gammaproteobacteria bacterium]
MLSALYIQNFAIVSQLSLDCPSKMSAFTGETGAGKSIMIDALALLLGARADGGVVRPHTDKCDISAQFFYDSPSNIEDWLLDHELENDHREVIIRRTINKEGRSKFFINDMPSTAAQVKTIGQMLVHIHGQHEQQNLLSHSHHREHLDNFAQAQSLRLQVKTRYQDYLNAKSQVEMLSQKNQSQEQLQLWEYQLSEIEDLAPLETELDALHLEHDQLHHAHQYLAQVQHIEELMNGENDFAISRQLHQVLQSLHALPKDHPSIQTAKNLIDSAIIQIDETQHEIKQFSNQIQINHERLHNVEQRMSRWHQLARKFQIDPHQLPFYAETLSQNIAKIKNIDVEKKKAQQALELALQNYIDAATTLRILRSQHATQLAHAIEQIIKELGMPHAQLTIDIQPLEDFHPHGMDKIEYLISTNPGLEPGPLAKIASGGELSRISLSIHLITAQRGATPTLFFDEVDVGIGGATAMKVGQRLRELGERLQVFCVTHQPQVASCAHQHFQVSKYSEHQQTFSSVIQLDKQGRIDEIARMLGGLSITEQTRNNAKELLDLIT